MSTTRHRPIAPMLTLLIATVAGVAMAHGSSVDQVETIASAKDPIQQIPHTLKALADAKAGEYGKLRSEDRQRLEAADRDIQAMTAGDRDLNTLDEQERTRLFNAQETVMAVVSGLKRSQLVCSYRQNAGTRFRTKTCLTRDMAEAQQRAARESTHEIQKLMCTPGEGNACGN